MAALPFFCRAFASKLSTVPILVLAVTETGANVFFTNEQMKTLLTEGNAFADARHASFMTTCANFQQQSMLTHCSSPVVVIIVLTDYSSPVIVICKPVVKCPTELPRVYLESRRKFSKDQNFSAVRLPCMN